MVLGVSYLGGIANGIATGRVGGRGVNDERLVDQRPGMQKAAAVAAPDRRLRVRPGWLEARLAWNRRSDAGMPYGTSYYNLL